MDAQNEQTSEAITQSILTRPGGLTNIPLAQILDSLPETVIDFDDKEDIPGAMALPDTGNCLFVMNGKADLIKFPIILNLFYEVGAGDFHPIKNMDCVGILFWSILSELKFDCLFSTPTQV